MQYVDKTINLFLFAKGEKCSFHQFFHSAQGRFLLCGVASTHLATQEASSTASPLFSLSSFPFFYLQSPPHLPMVETINRAGFHGAVWLGYHSHSFPLLSLSLALFYSEHSNPHTTQYSGGRLIALCF